jgi:hypothetical protein
LLKIDPFFSTRSSVVQTQPLYGLNTHILKTQRAAILSIDKISTELLRDAPPEASKRAFAISQLSFHRQILSHRLLIFKLSKWLPKTVLLTKMMNAGM